MSIATVTSSSVVVWSYAVTLMLLQHKPLGGILLIVVRFLLQCPHPPILIHGGTARGLHESIS